MTPAGGGEICRAATICNLNLELEKLDPKTEHTSLMYEVSTRFYNGCSKFMLLERRHSLSQNGRGTH